MTLRIERSGNGPDLALLHGWGMHSGVWDEVVPALASRFRVHAVDLPGHGHSGAVAAEGLDRAAAEVAAQLPAGAALCGWSLGALVALRIAHLAPGKARRMALVSATPCFVERPDWPHAMKAGTLEDFARGLRQDRDGTLERFVRLNALNGANGRAATRAFTDRLFARGAPPAAALEATLGWLRDTDVRDEMPNVSAPTLVMHGARDMIAPVAAGRWLAHAIPGARLVEIPDAGHLPFFTHRSDFLAALEEFVG